MSKKHSIDQITKTLVFIDKPKSLNKDSIRSNDRKRFTSVVIPNSVSTIGGEAFEDCTSLVSINIPNSVSTIDYWAFRNCTGLTSIHIPNSVTAIVWNTFRNCSALDSVHTPNSVKVIEWSSFNNCSSLASIHIPNSVTSIDYSSFTKCPRLHTAFLQTNAKINLDRNCRSFQPQTSLLRPRLKPIISLQKKFACRATKEPYSIYL